MELIPGNKISKQLADILLDKTTSYDRHELSVNKGGKPSSSAIEKVLYRTRPLSELTIPVIMELSQIAFERNLKERNSCNARMSTLRKAFGFIKSVA